MEQNRMHQRKAEAAQNNIRSEQDRARNDPTHHTITFDLQQVRPTPKLTGNGNYLHLTLMFMTVARTKAIVLYGTKLLLAVIGRYSKLLESVL